MNIVCLDLEGVLVPEIWIAFAKASNIPELKRTTRDEPDYDKLMKWRLGILKEHGLGLKEIQQTIAQIDPMPGAKEFLDELRSMTQVIIISRTNHPKIIIAVTACDCLKTNRLQCLYRCQLRLLNSHLKTCNFSILCDLKRVAKGLVLRNFLMS